MSGKKKDYRNSPKMNGEPNVKRGSYKTFHSYTGMHTHTHTYTYAHEHVHQWGTELARRAEGKEGSGRHPLGF